MVITQDLGRMVPSSRLAEELLTKKSSLQAEITKLEHELSTKPIVKTDAPPEGIKKIKDEDGQVRIWSSSSP
jgi:L-lactate utilization protein LutC